MSNEAWNFVRKAMEESVVLINKSAEQVPSDGRGIELAKRIFENIIKRNNDPVMPSISYLKDEIRTIFG
jgi:hypothetical protein